MAKKATETNPFEAVQGAYESFKAKELDKNASDTTYHDAIAKANADHQAALEAAAKDHDAVVKSYNEALDYLRQVQAVLNEMLGNAAKDPRIRMSA